MWRVFCACILGAGVVATACADIRLQPVQNVSIQPKGFTFQHAHLAGSLPSLVYGDDRIMYREPAKFRWTGGAHACTGLDAQIHLPHVGDYGAHSVYRLSDSIGVLIWIGDVHLSLTPMRGNAWQSVFHEYCQGSTRGYRIAMQPVLLRRNAAPRYIEALPPNDVRVASIRLRRNSGAAIQGRTVFDVSLGTFAIDTRSVACRFSVPDQVQLSAARRGVLAQVGASAAAGAFTLTLDCGEPVSVTLVDLLQPDNRSQGLSVMAGEGRAAGVALQLIKPDGNALVLGQGTRVEPKNRLSASTQPTTLKVQYVRLPGAVRGGMVSAMLAVTLAFE